MSVTAPCRHGSTLVELVIGITVAAMVVTLAVAHIVRHQRAYDSVAAAVELRARLRDASDILAADLRGSSAAGDSILVALDTAVEFYSVIGASTLCSAAGSRVTLPPDSLATGRLLSSWVATPDTGDFALILTDSAALSPPVWERYRIGAFSSISTAVGCPTSAGLLSASDVAASGRAYDVTLTQPISAGAHRGSPLRFTRRVRYSVYRGGDGKWYLGYRRCAAACASIQPISGPYESRAGAPLQFRYLSRSGSVVAGRGPTTEVARVDIVARANYLRPIRLPGTTEALGDSATVTVALRNRQ